jgi:hypothetical protein
MNLETLKNVLLCPPFYANCPPFQEAPSGNPSLDFAYFWPTMVENKIKSGSNLLYSLWAINYIFCLIVLFSRVTKKEKNYQDSFKRHHRNVENSAV